MDEGRDSRDNLYFRMVGNNYNTIARYYDRIHHLFYGQAEIHAQVELLEYVQPGDRLLIVGGGTGWILERIAAKFPSALEITYIEASSRMMELSKARNCGENKVEFVSSVIEDWKGGKEYDCILTGLFFDNFVEPHAAEIVSKLSAFLRNGGYWLESDFYYPRTRGKLWQAILLWVMYASSRLICRVEAKKLPDMDKLFVEAGYRLVYTTFHYQRFIRGVVYQKI